MLGVEFRELDLVADREYGQIFEFDNRRTTGRLILVTRKAGTVSGRGYHTGRHPNKDPEIGVLLSGVAEFYGRNAAGEEVRRVFDRPVMYVFHRGIYHEVRAVSDIRFLEFNGSTDGDGDSFAAF